MQTITCGIFTHVNNGVLDNITIESRMMTPGEKQK